LISLDAVNGGTGADTVIAEKSFRTSTPPCSTLSFPHGAEKFPDG
jgi:hypothetical protein